MYVYRVKVSAHISEANNRTWVNKDIIRCRVVKLGREYLSVSAYPKSYGDSGAVKVPKSECYTELDDAKREADSRANELIASLNTAVRELKEKAKVHDRLDEVFGQTD